MQFKKFMAPTATLLLALLLASGCAKKPTADETAVTQSEEISQEQVAAVETPSVTEQSVKDQTGSELSSTSAGLVRIHFDFDQYILTAEARRILADNADYLKAHEARVQIQGHCDERGSDEYNLALGEKRALAVKNYLATLGVDKGSMSVISFGEEVPLVNASTEEAWAENRRAEFKEMN